MKRLCMMLSKGRSAQHDEKVTLDKLQGYADDTKDMTATKGRALF